MNRRVSKIARFSPVVIIVLISSCVYCNALFNGFVFDDVTQVLENPWIRDVGYLHDIFSKDVWNFKSHAASNYYRPFMHVIYMFDYHVFGLRPWGFHLVNVLFHVLNAVLVFLVASRLLRGTPYSLSAPCPDSAFLSAPFIASLLFATHPVHTEAVTWIAGIPDLSFAFFFLLSFYLYVRSEEKSNWYYFFSVVSFFFAALCKEPALALPIVLAAYDYIFKKAGGRLSDSFKRHMPFLAVAAMYFMMRFHALGGFAPDKRHADLSVYQYVINVFPLFIQYLGKLFFPVNLNAFYVAHPISSILETKGILSLMGTAAFVIASCMAFKKSKAAFFSILLVVVPLLPALYIPGLGVCIFAERYLYLSSAGFVMLLALFHAWVRGNYPKRAAGLTMAFIILTGLYSTGTVDRNVVWRDDYTLWADTVNKSPDGALVHVNFGQAIQTRGRRDEAIEHYRIAAKLDPNDPIAHFNMGLAFFLKGWMDMAVEQFQIVLSQDPDYPDAGYYLQLAMSSKSH